MCNISREFMVIQIFLIMSRSCKYLSWFNGHANISRESMWSCIYFSSSNGYSNVYRDFMAMWIFIVIPLLGKYSSWFNDHANILMIPCSCKDLSRFQGQSSIPRDSVVMQIFVVIPWSFELLSWLNWTSSSSQWKLYHEEKEFREGSCENHVILRHKHLMTGWFNGFQKLNLVENNIFFFYVLRVDIQFKWSFQNSGMRYKLQSDNGRDFTALNIS